MKKIDMRILLIMLVLVVGCSSKPVQTNIKGEAISEKEVEWDEYNTRLRNLLTIPDSMLFVQGAIVPPGFSLDSLVIFDTTSTGNPRINIPLSNGKNISFIDLNNPEETNVLVDWSVSGYDSYNNVLYILEKREFDFWKLFGINLNTGNLFTVYEANTGSENEWMYQWSFSPDMKYLLKAGDLDSSEYGWSLVNLSNGLETKKLCEHYIEFITEPWWKRDGEFRIAYSRIPYVYGLEYLDDYKFYLLIKQNLPIRWSMLSTYEFITKEQIYNIKCEQISEKVLDTKKIEIQ